MSMLRTLLPAAAVTLAVAAPASALTALPTVQRTLAAADGSCATTAYTAKLGGFVTGRLDAAGGEWDLDLVDVASNTTLSRSHAFGPREVVQAWVTAGQALTLKACRVSGNVGTATATVDFVDAVKPKATKASIISIPRVSQAMYDKLTAAGFDMAEMSIRKHSMDLFIPSPAKLAAFKKFGLPFKVRVADLDKANAGYRSAEAARTAAGYKGLVPSGRTEYRFLADYQDEMREIAEANPSTVKQISIGETVQGRSIDGLEITKDVNATDDGKPTFFLMGAHHAREWPSAEIAMEYAHLLVNPGADAARVANILDHARVIVVPIINQDGFYQSRGENPTGTPVPDVEDEIGTNGTAEGLTGTFAYRRKNCNTIAANPISSAPEQQSLPCYYQVGVDNNRNYGFDWGGRGAGSSPTDQTYRGTGPWSEPENQAVWHTSQNRPVTVMITLHTIAALVLRSPGLSSAGLAPDEALLKNLGDRIGNRTGYTSQYGWQLYDTTGTAEDWNYGAAGTMGYTIEIGPSGGDFHADYAEAVEEQWVGMPKAKVPAANRGNYIGGGMKDSLLLAAEYAFDPKTHSIVTGTGTPGAELTLSKTFTTATSPVCLFAQGVIASAPAPLDCAAEGTIGNAETPDGLTYKTHVRPDGTFTWHVTQSTRPFEAFDWDPDKKVSVPTGVKEYWTLTCGATGKTQQVYVERAQTLNLGNVCA
jgi:hypothetical protein